MTEDLGTGPGSDSRPWTLPHNEDSMPWLQVSPATAPARARPARSAATARSRASSTATAARPKRWTSTPRSSPGCSVDQRRPRHRGRGHRRPRAGQGADPRDPARPGPPGRHHPRRPVRGPGDEEITLEVPVRLIGIPDGVRNFGGVLDHVLPSWKSSACRATSRTISTSTSPRSASATRSSCATSRWPTPRCSTIPTPRSARWWRPAEEATAVVEEVEVTPAPSPSSSGSPRPRARRPNRRAEPCVSSWGWATPARSTTKPGTTPGSILADTWPPVAAGTLRRAGRGVLLRRGEPARVAEGGGRDVRPPLLKPQTYMNRSGAAIASAPPPPVFDPSHDLLVLVDDVALPLGKFRLRGAGSAGGHNGLKSIEARSSGRTTPGSGSGSGRSRRRRRARRFRPGPVHAGRPAADRRCCSTRWPRPSNAGWPRASNGP